MSTKNAHEVLAERHGYSNSERYLRILEFLMTPQQAQISAELPTPLEEIAARLELPLETVKAEIDTLFRKGVVFPKNFQTLEFPRFSRGAGQLHDSTQSLLNLNLYDDHAKEELFQLWEDFLENEYYFQRMEADKKRSGPQLLRVVPAYRAIEDLPDITPDDDVREMVKAQQLISVVSCSCRARRTGIGKTCEHSHDTNCIQFNRSAEYSIYRGHGRKLSLDEALEMLDEIEDHGLVHQWLNARTMKWNVMCNCCVDCCIWWHPIDEHGGDIADAWEKTRFQAEVDQSLCNGCQVCVVERCMFGAIDMVRVPRSKMLKAQINPEKCFGCGACVLKCSPGAIRMKAVRPVEFIPEPQALGR